LRGNECATDVDSQVDVEGVSWMFRKRRLAHAGRQAPASWMHCERSKRPESPPWRTVRRRPMPGPEPMLRNVFMILNSSTFR
jgi:hypothetical protein